MEYIELRKPLCGPTEPNASITSVCLLRNFFDKENSAIIMVNGKTYRSMKTDFFVSDLYGIDVNDVEFQMGLVGIMQIPKTSHTTIDLCH